MDIKQRNPYRAKNNFQKPIEDLQETHFDLFDKSKSFFVT